LQIELLKKTDEIILIQRFNAIEREKLKLLFH